MNVEYVLCELETVQFSVNSVFNVITGIAEYEGRPKVRRHEGGLIANQLVPIARRKTNPARVLYVTAVTSAPCPLSRLPPCASRISILS